MKEAAKKNCHSEHEQLSLSEGKSGRSAVATTTPSSKGTTTFTQQRTALNIGKNVYIFLLVELSRKELLRRWRRRRRLRRRHHHYFFVLKECIWKTSNPRFAAAIVVTPAAASSWCYRCCCCWLSFGKRKFSFYHARDNEFSSSSFSSSSSLTDESVGYSHHQQICGPCVICVCVLYDAEVVFDDDGVVIEDAWLEPQRILYGPTLFFSSFKK